MSTKRDHTTRRQLGILGSKPLCLPKSEFVRRVNFAEGYFPARIWTFANTTGNHSRLTRTKSPADIRLEANLLNARAKRSHVASNRILIEEHDSCGDRVEEITRPDADGVSIDEEAFDL